MKLTFCGAAGTVTGSCHLLTLDDGYTILLDCGLYQGRDDDLESFNQDWLFDPAKIDCLVLSHAHIDHSGRIPKLVRDGFKGRIYSTHATRDLCSIMLMDSAQIQIKEADWINRRRKKKNKKGEKPVEPLYYPTDARKALDHFIGIPYDHSFGIHPDVDVTFADAGHILGSANVTLKIRRGGIRDTVLGFSGDIGRPERPILRDPKPLPACDYLICESTYGDKLHGPRESQEEHFLNVIKDTCVERKGKLIIPAFSIGRTQEIVYMIDKMESSGLLPKGINVYVDSPLAINATEIFRMHPECFDEELLEYITMDPDPFGFNNLHYVKRAEDSKKLNNAKSAIIISASGMITAGRIKHHVYNSIESEKNTILIVGYCAPHTIGARLAAGAEKIKIFGEQKQVKARVEIMNSFSAHGDQKEMLDFLQHQDPKRLRKIFLVHGEPKRQNGFKIALEDAGYDNVSLPVLGESVSL
jgi:metallo-beta-lactamase family protein